VLGAAPRRRGYVAAMPRLDELLDPPEPARTLLVTPDDVGGQAAWHVLVRDGALVRVRGHLAVLARTDVTPGLRARSLVDVVPRTAVAAGRTAAWVHTGAPRSETLDLAYGAGRHRPEVWAAARVWQAPLMRGDWQSLGGVRVTTPLRTVVDVALRDDPELALPVVLALVMTCGVALDDAARRLESRARAVGRPRARLLLGDARAALAAQAAPVP